MSLVCGIAMIFLSGVIVGVVIGADLPNANFLAAAIWGLLGIVLTVDEIRKLLK